MENLIYVVDVSTEQLETLKDKGLKVLRRSYNKYVELDAEIVFDLHNENYEQIIAEHKELPFCFYFISKNDYTEHIGRLIDIGDMLVDDTFTPDLCGFSATIVKVSENYYDVYSDDESLCGYGPLIDCKDAIVSHYGYVLSKLTNGESDDIKIIYS